MRLQINKSGSAHLFMHACEKGKAIFNFRETLQRRLLLGIVGFVGKYQVKKRLKKKRSFDARKNYKAKQKQKSKEKGKRKKEKGKRKAMAFITTAPTMFKVAAVLNAVRQIPFSRYLCVATPSN